MKTRDARLLLPSSGGWESLSLLSFLGRHSLSPSLIPLANSHEAPASLAGKEWSDAMREWLQSPPQQRLHSSLLPSSLVALCTRDARHPLESFAPLDVRCSRGRLRESRDWIQRTTASPLLSVSISSLCLVVCASTARFARLSLA